MLDKKLIRTDQDYFYFMEGATVLAKGSINHLKSTLRGVSLPNLDLALDLMTKNNHTVADFGIAGFLIYTLPFINYNTSLQSETH